MGTKTKYSRRIVDNRNYFDHSLKAAARMVEDKRLDEAAVYLNKIARFAWKNCTGYYANWQLEGLLNTVGNSLPENAPVVPERKEQLNVLHVATELYKTGGHTRLLLNWIKNDKENKHTIAITRQSREDLRQENVDVSGLESDGFIFLDSYATVLQKAARLRVVTNDYDCIILHIHPDDIIPVIAFSTANMPPVAFMNHADHIFWVGASVSDIVLQIRNANIGLDAIRRSLTNQYFLPIPILQDGYNKEYETVRSEIGIGENEILLLSTGQEYKYKPLLHYNLFEHSLSVLNKYPNVVFYIAGVALDSELAKQYPHPRIKYLGEITDLAKYETACDIYIEGYPFTSYTALLQAGKKGKPIQLMYEPLLVIKIFDDNLTGFKYPTEKDWEADLGLLIEKKEKREQLTLQQQEHICQFYTDSAWKALVAGMYNELLALKHKVDMNTESFFINEENEWYIESTSQYSYIDLKNLNVKPAWSLIFSHYMLVFKRRDHILYLKQKIKALLTSV